MHDFNFLQTIVTIAFVLGVILVACAFLIYVERKVAAYVQDRLGPNRVGPAGLFQSVADGLKFLFKEDIIPSYVDRVLFILAPAIALSTALLATAVVPFGATMPPPGPGASAEELASYRQTYQFVIAPGLDIGIVFIFAVTSLTVYAIILGGWSANNKYSFIGGLRSSAQLISYEIPLGLSILGVILLTGSLNLERVIARQTEAGGAWNVFYQPLGFLIFLVAGLAECNRLPFDLPEAEQELIGGYHTEYSALKLAMFFLGEYTHLMTISFLNVTLFFGGWHFPFLAGAEAGWLIKLLVFAFKVTCFILFFMLIRWTLPRFRFDQLMALAWKVLIPLALANLVCVMIVQHLGWTPWLLLPASLVLLVAAAWISALPEPQPQQT
jgi:NADH-quinone oxidoreductase subunit H